MAQWVLSVAGIAILSVLADVILPSGQTRKYIKTVIGVVVTLVLVQPVLAFASDKSFFDETTTATVDPQQQYLSYVEDMQSEGVEKLQSELSAAGFCNPTVTFSVKTRQYVVNIAENYSAELYAAAQSAVMKAKCKYFVKFIWNNSE